MKSNVRLLSLCAVLGAAYAVMTMALAPISYGAVQFRISEALCVMPFFVPGCEWGLFVGCLLANLLTGNVFDVVFGSLATLGAGICTACIGRRGRSLGHAAMGCLMPVLFNAVVIGVVITMAYNGLSLFAHPSAFALNALQVGLGEAGVMFLLGLPLCRFLPKKRFFREFTDKILQNHQ